jgi:predicted nucleic acid-binding protein
VFLTNSGSPWHGDAARTIGEASSAGTRLAISTQVVREYLAVASRDAGTVTGLPGTVGLANARAFSRGFDVLPETGAILDELLALVDRFHVSGRQVHDANIVATMQAHRIRRLLTRNVSDFVRFATLIEVMPLASMP